MPVAYSIRQGGGPKLDIALIEMERLLLHEETIPEMLDSLTRNIREDDVLRAPVIVDRETLVVLDGMHRVKALRSLGCRFTCACLVDYKNPEIKVERWCRTISKPFDAGKAAEVAEELGLRLSPRDPCHSRGPDEYHTVMAFRDSCYDVEAPDSDPLSAFEAIRELEIKLRRMGFEVEYETVRDAEEKLKGKAVEVVLYPPMIRKEQVVEIARKGRVFNFKATRHIIPARPVGVDVPLRLLQDLNLSNEEANEWLSVLLSRKRLRYVPSRGIWRGRRYDEGLYIFSDA